MMMTPQDADMVVDVDTVADVGRALEEDADAADARRATRSPTKIVCMDRTKQMTMRLSFGQ
jgi:hypothetical protein